jgi:phospholipid transport system transporter-binding protein
MGTLARIEPVGDRAWRVVGELTLHALPALLAESARLRAAAPAPGQEFELDLSGVTRIDSSAIALLLAWTRAARQAGTAVRFRQAPRQLLAIAEVSGVRSLLPLAG